MWLKETKSERMDGRIDVYMVEIMGGSSAEDKKKIDVGRK